MLLGGVLAILAFVLIFALMNAGNGQSGPPPPPTPIPKVSVVVAAKDLKGFTVIKEEDLKNTDIEQNQVLSGTTTLSGDIVGQMLLRDYQADRQILMEDVTDPGVSQVLGKNERGFVIAVKEINNFGGQLVDGDVVNVLWTRNFEITTAIVGPDGTATQVIKTLPTTKKILDNIKVLRVIKLRPGGTKKAGGNTAVNAQGGESKEADSEAAQLAALQGLYIQIPEPPPTAALILAITDQQAEVIKFARETGVVDLTLRAKDDADVERTTGITDKIMIEDYGVQVPELIIK
jgi:Flp pilus assembly protein CpaB